MCAIVGILNRDGRPASKKVVAWMTALLAHRGPDGDGLMLRGPVAFGHRRLAIIDPSGGQQPMTNEDGQVWVTYNGEIYNYRELAAELSAAGHVFRSRSDTEVIVHAWEQWGEDCVKRFRGMFAFAIMDWRAGKLFLARDHFGIKPLYFIQTEETMAFASELAALRRVPGFKADLDLTALDQYLWLQYIPAPRSIYRQIQKLPPAHCMAADLAGRVSAPREYWRVVFQPDQRRTEAELVEALDAAVADSVKAHLVSDVPFGAFLSGGVDSSLVVANMSRLLGRPVQTFSIGFEEKEFDETQHARFAATHCGAEPRVEIVNADALAILPDLVRHYGEPFGDSTAVPTFYISRLARQHVPMVLSGDGADELFAGYRSHGAWMAAWADKTGARPALLDWLACIQYVDVPQRLRLWRPEFRSHCPAPLEGFTREWDRAGAFSLAHKVQYLDLKTYLPDNNLAKVDIASMMHGLEVRTPFVDLRVVELAATIPDRFNFARARDGRWQLKRLLKGVAAKYFPAEFLNRPKMGFAMPLIQWLAPGGKAHAAVRRRLLGADSTLYDYFEPAVIKQLLLQNAFGSVWLLIFLEEWLRQNKVAAVAEAGPRPILMNTQSPANAASRGHGEPGPSPLGSRSRPKVLLLADRPGWAYDAAAQAISGTLSDEFEFRIEYVWQKPDLAAWPFDLIHVFFWGETYHQRFVSDPRRVIKAIRSHRWANEDLYGRVTPQQMVARYLSDAGTVSVSSRRLQALFAPYRPVWLAENGFDPARFKVRNRSGGRLRLGWAGNAKDPCKGLEDILKPAAAPDFELQVAGGGLDHAEMCDFYNSIDVFCIASTAEGQPATLPEALACGCFPVAVDVGVVPELLTHRRNGLIVNRTPAAFRAAFQWCAVNIGRVREAGLQNAQTMLRARTWSQVAGTWRAVFRHALQALATSNESTKMPGAGQAAPAVLHGHADQVAIST